jgi:ERCC4-type nuclease
MCPPVPFLQQSLGSYYHHAEKNFGLINKYTKYPTEVQDTQDEASAFKNRLHKIFVDTREQKPLKFALPIEVQTLKFGDYAFSNSSMSLNTYIERKSITDFIGTMSGGLQRFKKEIERSEEQEAKLVVLVEESMTSCLSFNHLPYVSKKIKATPEFIFHNVRELLQSHKNLHFLFVKGRKEASRVIEKLFLQGRIYHKVDLQLAYDLRKL